MSHAYVIQVCSTPNPLDINSQHLGKKKSASPKTIFKKETSINIFIKHLVSFAICEHRNILHVKFKKKLY